MSCCSTDVELSIARCGNAQPSANHLSLMPSAFRKFSESSEATINLILKQARFVAYPTIL